MSVQAPPRSPRRPAAFLQATRLLFLLALLAAVAGAAEQVRPAAVAGSWYPGDAEKLAAYLDHLLEKAHPDPAAMEGPPLRALIVPHAGYPYSGVIAASGYKLVEGRRYRRVVVLGPAHRGGFHGLSVADVAAYQTPLGRIPLDREAVEKLRGSELVTSDAEAHRQEHSIEMQLPLLQKVLQPGWKLVPILVGRLEPGDHARAAALLRPLLDEDTLLVVSTDFTHYGATYRYLPFPLDENTPQRIEALDRGAVEAILHKDAKAFLDYRTRTGITICGYQAVAILLELLPPDATGIVVAHTTSGALTGSYRLSVSYWAIAFRGTTPLNGDDPPPEPPADGLSDGDWQLLRHIAALGVRDAVEGRTDPKQDEEYRQLVEQLPERLKRPAGAFVTLWKGKDRLRGCVGYIPPLFPLYQAVYDNAYNAARNDSRFFPVKAEELPELQMDISVLSPLRPIESPEQFRVGEEGIVLDKEGRRAVYLPEVAERFGWSREETLRQLAMKAGLPPDAWQEKDARLSVFTSQERHFPSVFDRQIRE